MTVFFTRRTTIAMAIGLVVMFFMNFQLLAKDNLRVTYALYAGGFNVVDIKGTYKITKDRYAMTMDLKTVGILGNLAPWSGVIESQGQNKGSQSIPSKHRFANSWRGKTETSRFEFSQAGDLLSYTRQKNNGDIHDKMPAKDVYQDLPVDLLSALFRVMNTSTCDSTVASFDGKRRFDMAFRTKGTDYLEQSKYSIFEGNVEICEIEIIPVAGKWREKKRGWMSIQDQAKGKGQLPRLWFGKIRDDFPPIPVRFLIKTNYGAMVMHLKNIDNSTISP